MHGFVCVGGRERILQTSSVGMNENRSRNVRDGGLERKGGEGGDPPCKWKKRSVEGRHLPLNNYILLLQLFSTNS